VDTSWAEVFKTVGAGLAGTVILLLPGYVLGVTYSRGIRGPAVTEKDSADAAVDAVLVDGPPRESGLDGIGANTGRVELGLPQPRGRLGPCSAA
jgi:hypothetical protein